jgi:FkbM family methyltransferase
MITYNPELIKIPAFLTKFADLENLSVIQKVKLVIKGKIVAYCLKNFSESAICKVLNRILKFEGEVEYKEKFYIKNVNGSKIYYPNIRFTRILTHQEQFLNHLFDSYLLDNISFQNDDYIIDCGSNVGELSFAFKQKGFKVDYLGIEPELNTYKCLEKNTSGSNLNICLSDKESTIPFYVDSVGANSSAIRPDTSDTVINVTAKRLDQIIESKNIKLLKIDAEGAEPEVLMGCEGIIKNIEYISVDCGAERGQSQETTFVEVLKIMNKYNFEIVDINQRRLITLFKNTK